MEVLDANTRLHPEGAEKAVSIHVLPSRVTSW